MLGVIFAVCRALEVSSVPRRDRCAPLPCSPPPESDGFIFLCVDCVSQQFDQHVLHGMLYRGNSGSTLASKVAAPR